jgi:hypothetical protein
MTTVARKHIIAALEVPETLLFFPKYAIKATYYQGKDRRIGEFGWTISVVPEKKIATGRKRKVRP